MRIRNLIFSRVNRFLRGWNGSFVVLLLRLIRIILSDFGLSMQLPVEKQAYLVMVNQIIVVDNRIENSVLNANFLVNISLTIKKMMKKRRPNPWMTMSI